MKQKYYTPYSEPAPAHVVKAYRKLRRGEKLRETDRVWLPVTGQLVPTILAGHTVCTSQGTACHYYRRKSAKR